MALNSNSNPTSGDKSDEIRQTNTAFTPMSNPISSEKRWVDQITEMFKHEQLININEDNSPICIFRVPKSLSASKPEAYTPQLIALGPYHHLKPELYEMENYKLSAVIKFLNQHPTLNFQATITKLTHIGPTIRSCYRQYVDLDNDTLAWIISIDGLFLLHVFEQFFNKCVNFAGSKLTEDAILRDMTMLENQIPFTLLNEISSNCGLSFSGCSNDGISNESLKTINFLFPICQELSPLDLNKDYFPTSFDAKHLLDLMYHLIPRQLPCLKGMSTADFAQKVLPAAENAVGVCVCLGVPGAQLLQMPLSVLKGLPWDKFSAPMDSKKDNQSDSTEPKTEGIEIPSVSRLCKVGVKFSHTSDGIRDVKFDEEMVTFYLPVITLNVNSEVVLRNLVAHEASLAKSGSTDTTLELSLYIDLMNGIIDTAKDAKLLRKMGIIKGRLGDSEVADLFKGMSRSIGKPDHKSEIEKTIDKVNKYYNSTRRVKMYKLLKMYVYASWKVLTVVATVLMLLLLCFQSFCNVYGCTRFLGHL